MLKKHLDEAKRKKELKRSRPESETEVEAELEKEEEEWTRGSAMLRHAGGGVGGQAFEEEEGGRG